MGKFLGGQPEREGGVNASYTRAYRRGVSGLFCLGVFLSRLFNLSTISIDLLGELLPLARRDIALVRLEISYVRNRKG